MKQILSLITILALSAVGLAQTPTTVKIAVGSSSGTYEKFLAEIEGVTKDVVTFEKYPDAHGSVENLDALITNKVSLAFMHSDIIDFRGKRENLKAFETVLTLFKEEVHFVAPRASKRKPVRTGGFAGFGGTTTAVPVLNSIEDLKGLRVGASGGGAITAQVIKLMGNIPYEFVQFEKGDQVMAALNDGSIDAAVFVGGAPLPNIEKLNNAYKLLPMGQQTLTLLKSVYSTATITYPKMAPEGISTVAADALLVGRVYKSEKMVSMLRNVRAAFASRLLELQETPGIHPKWQEVHLDNEGTWPYMKLTPPAAGAK